MEKLISYQLPQKRKIVGNLEEVKYFLVYETAIRRQFNGIYPRESFISLQFLFAAKLDYQHNDMRFIYEPSPFIRKEHFI